MKILSIGGFFHDLNFTYLDINKAKSLISAEEERFSRIKGHSILNENYPTKFMALDYIFAEQNLSDNEINVIVISDAVQPKCIDYFKARFNSADFVYVGHHLSHIYNVFAFFPEYMQDSDCVALDGFGDGHSGILAKANNNKLKILSYLSQKSSLGLLYTSATQHLGLGSFGSEGKLQGLAPYGDYEDIFSISNMLTASKYSLNFDNELLNNSLFDDQEFYALSSLSTNEYFSELLPKRFSDEKLTKAHENFAHTIQEDIFHVITSLIGNAFEGSSENLIVSGGLAQNSSLINRLNGLKQYKNIITTTSCSDRGNSLGALKYFCHTNLIEFNVESPFLGSTMGDVEEEFHDFSTPTAAKYLSNGKVIALAEGRSELGARALCNRSILASPENPQMKDYINISIKHRELFRPFAPVCLERNVHKYFDCSKLDKYMTRCCSATELAQHRFPSAVHVDKTSRIQFVSEKESNRTIYKLLDILENEYGIDVLINTSLNGNGQPIANSFSDAARMSKSMGIKLLTSKSSITAS